MGGNGIMMISRMFFPVSYGDLIMKYKKIVAALLVFCICLGLGTAILPEAQAANETYDMSEQFKSGKFYDNFKKVAISGHGAADTVAMALSQIGYHEGDSDKDLDGLNGEGSRDFVEYNVLYGMIDNNQGNGVSYGYSWCASFINWCLRQAGVGEECSGGDSFISCWKWRKACIENNIYEEKQGYAPQMGDIIFFKDVYDPSIKVDASHVGLVLFSDNAAVYTIEGNTNAKRGFEASGDNVAVKSYSLNSEYIVGYGTPNYAKESKFDLLGWQNTADLSCVKPLNEFFDAAKEGAYIRPVFGDRLYTVEFKHNNGTLISKIVGEKGLPFETPKVNLPADYSFEGWETDVINVVDGDVSYIAVVRDHTPWGRFVESSPLTLGLTLSASFLVLGVIMLILLYRKKPE